MSDIPILYLFALRLNNSPDPMFCCASKVVIPIISQVFGDVHHFKNPSVLGQTKHIDPQILVLLLIRLATLVEFRFRWIHRTGLGKRSQKASENCHFFVDLPIKKWWFSIVIVDLPLKMVSCSGKWCLESSLPRTWQQGDLGPGPAKVLDLSRL